MISNSRLNSSYVNEGLDCSTLTLNNTLSYNFNKELNEKSSQTKKRQSLKIWMQKKAHKAFTKKMLYRRIPILNWLPKYNSQDAVGDLVAGITVGLTVIPQALAFTSIAGVPPAVSFNVIQ